MNVEQEAVTLARGAEGLVTGRSWVKLGAYTALAVVVLFILYVALDRLSGREAARSHGEAVKAEETGNAAAATASEAMNTVTQTFEYHTQVDHIVKEGQANVDQQNSIEAADAAGADALCRVHHDLCRAGPAAAP